MRPAARARSWFDHAAPARIRLALGAALAVALLCGRAHAEVSPSPQLVVIPSECALYWSIPGGAGGAGSPVGWYHLLSFAACVQDATIVQVEDTDELEGLVDELQAALDPALRLYMTAVEQGPGPIKVRAALQMAMAEAALIARARMSIVTPWDLRTNAAAAARHRQLHERLEPLLAPPARFACTVITEVDRVVSDEPGLAPDAITRNLLASARRVATQLRKSWPIPEHPEMIAGSAIAP